MRDMERFCHSKNRWLVKTVLLLLLLCTLFSTVTVASAETDLKALLDPLERETFPAKTSELAVTVRQAYLEDPAAFAAVACQYDIWKVRYFQDLIAPEKNVDPEGFAAVLEATERLALPSMPEEQKRFAFELLMDLWWQESPINDMASVNYEQCVVALSFSDGGYATFMSGVCSALLVEDPVRVVRAVAREEDLYKRYIIASNIVYETLWVQPIEDVFAVLDNADLNGAERFLVQYMKECAAAWPNDYPDIPQTADEQRNILLAAAVLVAVSSIASGALLFNRKRFA